MPDRSKFTFSNIILALVLLFLAARLSAALIHYAGLARPALAFPYQLDYGEGPLLDQTLRLASGENIYRNDFSQPPFTISNYPPLFLLLQVPFAWLFGPAFWYGRLISLIAALLAAMFLGLALYALTRDWIAGVVSGLLLLSFPYVQYWSLLNRIDLLALALSWAGLWVLARFSNRRWGIPTAAALLTAAIFTRQSYALAAPFGGFAWLLASRRWRDALRLTLITAGAVLGLFLLFNLISGGGFYMNIVTANVNPFNWETVRWNFNELRGNALFILIIAAAYALFGWSAGGLRAWSLAAPYLLAAAASAITIGKEGSNVNYLLELAAGLCFAGGAALAWARRHTLPSVRSLAPVLVIIVLIIQVGMLNEWTAAGFDGRLTEKFDQEEHIGELFQRVKAAEGIVLADEYMGLIPLAGKRLYLQPFEYKQLYDARIWDDRPILNMIRSNQVDLVLMYQAPDWPSVDSRWTPLVRNLVRRWYKLEDLDSPDRIYTPR